MPNLKEVSTITAKGQTTVPKAVRQVLGVDYGGRIAFLARDIEQRPESVKPLSREFAARLSSLTKGKRVDLEAPIDGPVDL